MTSSKMADAIWRNLMMFANYTVVSCIAYMSLLACYDGVSTPHSLVVHLHSMQVTTYWDRLQIYVIYIPLYCTTNAVCMIPLIQILKITRFSHSTVVQFFVCTPNLLMYCMDVLCCTVLYHVCLHERFAYAYMIPWNVTFLPCRLFLWRPR